MFGFVLLTELRLSRLKKFCIPTLLLFVFSCRTIPELTHSNIVDSLPPESNLIMKIAVTGNEALVETMMLRFGIAPRDFSNLAERMEHLAIGLELDSSPEGRRAPRIPFHIAAIGNWPVALFGRLLGEGWVRSGHNRWLSPTGLEIMLISGRELILSSGKLDSMLARTETASRNMELASVNLPAENADLAFWMTDPDLIHKLLHPVPVRDFTGAVIVDLLGGALSKAGSDAYSLDMFIHLSNPRFAESLALAMRVGFASQISETFDFLSYEFLLGLEIKGRASEVIVSHNSIPIVLLEDFLSFNFGLGIERFDSGN